MKYATKRSKSALMRSHFANEDMDYEVELSSEDRRKIVTSRQQNNQKRTPLRLLRCARELETASNGEGQSASAGPTCNPDQQVAPRCRVSQVRQIDRVPIETVGVKVGIFGLVSQYCKTASFCQDLWVPCQDIAVGYVGLLTRGSPSVREFCQG